MVVEPYHREEQSYLTVEYTTVLTEGIQRVTRSRVLLVPILYKHIVYKQNILQPVIHAMFKTIWRCRWGRDNIWIKMSRSRQQESARAKERRGIYFLLVCNKRFSGYKCLTPFHGYALRNWWLLPSLIFRLSAVDVSGLWFSNKDRFQTRKNVFVRTLSKKKTKTNGPCACVCASERLAPVSWNVSEV